MFYKNWIDKLSARFHIDVSFYLHSSSWLLLSQIGLWIRGLVSVLLLAAFLPKTTFGQFRYIIALFGLASMFSLSGLNSGIVRGITKGDTAVVPKAIKIIALVSPLGSLVLALLAMERFFYQEPTVGWSLCIAAILFPLYSLCGLYESILMAKEEIKKLSKITALLHLIFAGCFLLIAYRWPQLSILTVSFFGLDILLRGSITLREVRRLKITGDSASHLKLGHHLSVIGMISVLVSQLDQLLIQRFGGYGSLANYNIAILLPEQIKDVMNTVIKLTLKRFSQYTFSLRLLQQTRRHFWHVLLGSALLVGGYALTAPFVISFLFPAYRDQIFPSIIYAIGLLTIPTYVGISFAQAHHQIRKLWKINMSYNAIQLLSTVLLIPLFGAWGAILARTIARLGNLLTSYPSSETSKPA